MTEVIIIEDKYVKYQKSSIIDAAGSRTLALKQATSARRWALLAFEFELNLKFVSSSDNNLFELTPSTIYESVAHDKEN